MASPLSSDGDELPDASPPASPRRPPPGGRARRSSESAHGGSDLAAELAAEVAAMAAAEEGQEEEQEERARREASGRTKAYVEAARAQALDALKAEHAGLALPMAAAELETSQAILRLASQQVRV
jgi:hypothetical protein